MGNSAPPPPRDCCGCHLRSLCLIGALTSQELEELVGIRGPSRSIDAGVTFCHEGALAKEMYSVFSGWAIKYRILENGKRHILALALPGDLIGEYADGWSDWQYSVEAISPLSICSLKRAQLVRFRQHHPQLAEATIDLARRDERIVSEHLLSATRRSAQSAIAHLLLEIFVRLRRRGSDRAANAYFVPLTQEHIGDMIGFTTEYVNRLLREIRVIGLINLHNRFLTVPDFDKAAAAFDFDETYLARERGDRSSSQASSVIGRSVYGYGAS